MAFMRWFKRWNRMFILLWLVGFIVLLLPRSKETRLNEPDVQQVVKLLEGREVMIAVDLNEQEHKTTVNVMPKTVLRKTEEAAVNHGGGGGNQSQIVNPLQAPPVEEPQGLGKMGKAVIIDREKLSEAEKQEFDAGWKNHQFNQYLSDRISLHRSLPDSRHPLCKNVTFVDPLPSVSVIIIFFNEAWSTLLRTVHSVFDRSPPSTIKEILLVDDASDAPHLQKPLEDYVNALGVVRILRAPSRAGLTQVRLLGVRHATAEVLVFLDSHCECIPGWLEPLIAPIAQNWSIVTVPVIETIDDSTLAINPVEASLIQVGIFDWNLNFNWRYPTESMRRGRKSVIDHLRTPAMAGGLFAMSKAYFEYLGTYDGGMDTWGAENLEISFRIWMCGGVLYTEPCSHVGHIFRKKTPYKWPKGFGVIRRNNIRLAEVWLDDYKKYYYEKVGGEKTGYGDISARKELRRRLNCTSFEWYLDNVYPEMLVPEKMVAFGEIRSQAVPRCFDAVDTAQTEIRVFSCHGRRGTQFFMLTKNGEIVRNTNCLDYAGSSKVQFFLCHWTGGNQKWNYQQDNIILHPASNKCIQLSDDNITLIMAYCDANNQRQQWIWNRNTRLKT